ncbi:Hypothetical protein BCAN_A0544 [Brucella canis ATCC 23365]|uniref:Uncharacterized protein n=1 Tax=Brucella canis (strain ATCC 23365 / NCTC 10854 / RM-666) TaxID=483179 RepID=A9M9F7_BRUC2|nr:Hypothetical protein BCAN_A0544 [Brucella canis ATCC 23365]
MEIVMLLAFSFAW